MTDLVQYANQWSTHWAAGMWSAIWQCAVLALTVYLLTLVLKRAPAALRFWLWMLVPLRLLIMPIVTIELPVLPSPFLENTSEMLPEAAYEPMAGSYEPAYETSGQNTYTVGAEPAPIAAMTEASVVAPTGRVLPSVWTCLMAAWAFGSLFIAFTMIAAYRKTRRIVANAAPIPQGPVLDLTMQAAKMLRLRRAPRVVWTRENVSPFVLGVVRPVIVLPSSFSKSVSRNQLLAVLAHESAHLKRNDFVIGWIVALCEIVYFFHPVVYWAKRRLLLEREKACDEWVLATSRARPSHYAQAILDAATASCTARLHVQPEAVVAESFADLSQRIAAVAKCTTPKPGLTARSYAAIIAAGALTIPGFAFTARGVTEADHGSTQETQSNAPGSLRDAASAPASLQARAEPQPETQNIRPIRFPEDSNLGVLSVRTHRGTYGYRLGREGNLPADFDRWRTIGHARGTVNVPVGQYVKLTVYNGGLNHLDDLLSLAPDDIHTLSFQFTPLSTGEPLIYDQQLLPYVRNLTGLKTLELITVETTGTGLKFMEDFENLEYLAFGSGAYFDDASLVHLRKMKSLEVLNCWAPVSDEGLRRLAPLKSLRELSIKPDNIRGYGLAFLADTPSLEFLQIHGDGRPGGLSSSALRYLEEVRSLRSLLLYATTNINDAATVHLAKLSNLEELKFIKPGGGINVTDTGMPALASLTRLHTLDLSGTVVTDRGVEHLTKLTALENLRLPPLSRTRTGGYGITDAALTSLSALPRLRSLGAGGMLPVDLSDPGPFTDRGCEAIARLSNLESLSIASGSGITDAGMKRLARLQNLKSLSIMCNGVTNGGLASIASIGGLKSLHLNGPKTRAVTVAGLNHLNALTQLTSLHASNIAQDNAGLDLSNLTALDALMLEIREKEGRRSPGAVRDEDLASIGNLSRLTHLSFSPSPKLTDDGLAPIAQLTNLERLFVGGDNLTDQALAHVAGLTNVYQLSITGDFTDEGLRHLDGLANIRYLTINAKRGVSNQSQARIRQNLPNLYAMNLR